MAVNQLERIAALAQRVGPLGQKSRGMRIEAEEWNGLVDVLLGVLQVERAQVEGSESALSERFSPKGHQHLGEVTLAWLDADLQSRVGGKGGSVPTRTALAEIEQKMAGLGAEVARLTKLVETQQKQLDRAAVSELDRSRALKLFDERFSGVENLRTLVATLSTEVGGVKSEVDTVLELRRSLSDPQGNPLDVAGMKRDLDEVRALRENLRGVDGELVRLRDVEVKLRELEDATGTGQGGLDRRIDLAVAAAEDRLDGKLDGRADALRLSLGADLEAAEGRLRGEVTGQIDGLQGTLDAALAERVAAAETGLRTQLDARLAQAGANIRADTVAAATGLINQRLGDLPQQIDTIAGRRVEEMRGALRDELTDTLHGRLERDFRGLENRLDDRVKQVEVRVTAVEERLPRNIAERVDLASEALSARFSQDLDQRLTATRASLAADIAAQVRSENAAATERLDQRVKVVVDDRLGDLDARIGGAVTAATRDLPEQIRVEVKTQVDRLEIPKRIDAGSAAVAGQIRSEQARALAELRAQSAEELAATTRVLRGENEVLRGEVNARNATLRQEVKGDLAQLEGRLRPDVFRVVPRRPIA